MAVGHEIIRLVPVCTIERAGGAVSTEMLHPPEMRPASAAASSTTYRFQVPFGLAPLNKARFAGAPSLPAGAGTGKGKPSGSSRFVGLNVPETKGGSEGKNAAASESRFNVTLVILLRMSPPTFENTMDSCP